MSSSGASRISGLTSFHIPYDAIKKEKWLGKGGFGTVYLGEWEHVSVAIKELNLEPEELSEVDQLEFEREVRVMQALRHPNVVLLYGTCTQSKCCLIMEYCVRGSLSKLLRSAEQIDWTIRLKWALEIAVGLNYLHNQKILHRDLKSDNILINKQSVAKIADFGLSQIKQNSISSLHSGMVGTIPWMAPEIMEAEKGDLYTEAADIYSYAVVVWELAARKQPYSGLRQNMVIVRVLQGKREEIPEEVLPPLKEVIMQCWQQNPEERMSLATVIKTLSTYQYEPITLFSLSPSQSVKTGDFQPQDPSPNIFSSYFSNPSILPSAKVITPSIIPDIAFGKTKWQQYFGDIGDEPPLPDDIHQILSSPCPFWQGKKVQDTHLLVLIPAVINNQPFTLNKLGELIQRPKIGHASKYNNYHETVKEELGAISLEAHWVLMTRDIIPGSQGKSYKEQKEFVTGYAQRTGLPYKLPKTLEASTAILIHYAQTGDHLYGVSPLTYTRCQEMVSNNLWPVAIGRFAAGGLYIYYRGYWNGLGGHDDCGVGAIRKLSVKMPKAQPTSLPALLPSRALDKPKLAIATITIPKVTTPTLPAIAFGKAKWEKYFGDVGIEPPLPLNIEQLLSAPCPIWPNKKVQETHLLVLIPNSVNGKPFHLDALSKLIQSPKNGFLTKYRFYDDYVKKELGTKNIDSHWVLMSRDVIPNSRSKTYDDQNALVQSLAQKSKFLYELPTVLEATTVILMEYVQTGIRLYSDNPWTYTRCQEKVDNNQWPVAIGGFTAAEGLGVAYVRFGFFYSFISNHGAGVCLRI